MTALPNGGITLKPRLFIVAALVALLVSVPVSKIVSKQKQEVNKLKNKIQQIEKQKKDLEKKLQAKLKIKSKIASSVVAEAAQPAPQPQPAPAPQPPAAAPVPPPVQQVGYAHAGCEQYKPLIAAYNWPVATMMAIMEAESSCIASNVGGPNRNGTYDYGLFQINNEAILDPAQNVARAYGKYTTQGLGAWSVYKTGAYLKYLR